PRRSSDLSRSTQIHRKRQLLSHHDDRLFLRLIETPAVAEREPFASLLPDRQAFVLDLASDYLLHHLATDPTPSAATRDLQHSLLVTRSRLNIASPETTITPITQRPELGHTTSRVGLVSGGRQDEISD